MTINIEYEAREKLELDYEKIITDECSRRTTRPRILRPLSVLRASQGRSAWVAMVGHSKQLSDRPACYDLSEQSARSRR